MTWYRVHWCIKRRRNRVIYVCEFPISIVDEWGAERAFCYRRYHSDKLSIKHVAL